MLAPVLLGLDPAGPDLERAAHLGLLVLRDVPRPLCLVLVATLVARGLARRRGGDVLAWSLALAVLAPVAAVRRVALVVELLPGPGVQPDVGPLVVTSVSRSWRAPSSP